MSENIGPCVLAIVMAVILSFVVGMLIGSVINENERGSYLTTNVDVHPPDSGVLICDENDECYFLNWDDIPEDFRGFIEETD